MGLRPGHREVKLRPEIDLVVEFSSCFVSALHDSPSSIFSGLVLSGCELSLVMFLGILLDVVFFH